MISVAYTSGPRTSMQALRIVAGFDPWAVWFRGAVPVWGGAAPACGGAPRAWSRRRMLPTSTTASSTTTPKAIARPASSIVLKVTPRR
jgi:hypothetical protein